MAIHFMHYLQNGVELDADNLVFYNPQNESAVIDTVHPLTPMGNA